VTRNTLAIGATVVIADNGALACEEAIRTERDECPFDAVLMDMQMPVMDGCTATRDLLARGFERPIVALTAHSMRGDRDNCREAVCDEYLPKPIDQGAVLGLVFTIVERARSGELQT